ncbi:Ala-tRNA(Pro) hydrolase [Defluviimonas sp. 20V17]|uniref:Alanine--tRNA ligase n=1 Tax=Allgaiera indica TaxID=765699 RepID=A0AAN5A1C9_9RHOB|nr:alanyl-tRNA editing protein [Allgaiera indica]KDB04469.1 Ala-tRNA(Pro) hydrolase [Defluviimonas sp. 20V17]GHE06182.1 Ala-tRNA(Pro) hydrolase [Allgaiera indica]SDX87543.1 Ala-tRNA(Pro) hydrolase [Allgaiera indica]
MSTQMLFRDDPYMVEAEATVVAHTPEGGLVLDRSVFYPTGGGQPGDSGQLQFGGGRLPIATAVKGEAGQIVLVPAEISTLPEVGTAVTQRLDWRRRHRHMRIHTALHLLSVVIPLPVTGGQIGADKGRVDFDMPEPLEDPAAIEAALNALIDRDLPVGVEWISEEELAANPGLVKTMSVSPPRGAGRIRLIRIGTGADQVDLQPCGGTHIARTGEIGAVTLGKIEKKGRRNRRVSIFLDA